MFRKQLGNVNVTAMLISSVVFIIILALVSMVKHGFDVGWQQFILPSSMAHVWDNLSSCLIALGLLICGLIVGVLLWALVIKLFNLDK